jgi:excisionase family DNA binding protein
MNRPDPDVPATPLETRYVSTAQVAEALGVSVTTVKRWVDEGILPAHRTAGGHRKLLMTDILRAVREGNLPQADLSRLMPKAGSAAANDPDALSRQFVAAIDALDTELVRGVIHGAYQAGLPVEVLADRVLAPGLAHVGREWEAGRLDVSHEHRITQACVSALYELQAVLRASTEKGRPVAVGGAPEGDHTVLATLLAKLTLLECGWDAVNLGPHTPASAFKSAIDELSPQLVWVSATHVGDADEFLAEYREVYEYADDRGAAVAIGGRGLTDSLRAGMPYTTFGDGLTHLASFARTLYRRPQRPPRGRPPGPRKKAVNGTTGESAAE